MRQTVKEIVMDRDVEEFYEDEFDQEEIEAERRRAYRQVAKKGRWRRRLRRALIGPELLSPSVITVIQNKRAAQDGAEILADYRHERAAITQAAEVFVFDVDDLEDPEFERELGYSLALKEPGLRENSFTVGAALPYLAGGSLGSRGVWVGDNVRGGGAFCFDPWELYADQVINGMSMLIMGRQGTGKSTLAKSLITRMVMHGRRAIVMTDMKGEWDNAVALVGGRTIRIEIGQRTRINPLDSGVRPERTATGAQMTDSAWAETVRSRRLSLFNALLEILGEEQASMRERLILQAAMDVTVADVAADCAATGVEREPIIPDLLAVLARTVQTGELDGVGILDTAAVVENARSVAVKLGRLTQGDLAGMLDEQTTTRFDPTAPMVSVNTKGLQGASREARLVVTTCLQSWVEAQVTNSNFGEVALVYEEGWDTFSELGTLERMVNQWKMAREYNIYNILLIHKLADFLMGGDAGSRQAALTRSLLEDTETKITCAQDPTSLRAMRAEFGLSDELASTIQRLKRGNAVWMVGQKPYLVENKLLDFEVDAFNTSQRLHSAVNMEGRS